MTIIAAIADGERVWMGSDSLAVNGWDQKHEAGPKVVRRQVGEGECLLGVSGVGALLSMLRYDLEVPTVEGNLDKWAYDVACAVTRLCFEAKPELTNESGKGINASLLLGFAGRLWSLATNEAWPRARSAAIGTGDEYALGVLHAVEHLTVIDPAEAIALAVQAACRHDLHCGGDLHIEVI